MRGKERTNFNSSALKYLRAWCCNEHRAHTGPFSLFPNSFSVEFLEPTISWLFQCGTFQFVMFFFSSLQTANCVSNASIFDNNRKFFFGKIHMNAGNKSAVVCTSLFQMHTDLFCIAVADFFFWQTFGSSFC